MTISHQSAASLTISRGPGAGRRFDIVAAVVTIGRDAQCDVQVAETWVSRQHARITWSGTEYIVEDLGSTNGTFVDGERVVGSRELRSGDRLQLGPEAELAFQVSMPAPLREMPVPPDSSLSPRSTAGPPQAHAPSPDSIPVQQRSFRQRRIWVWVLGLAGLLLILLIGGGVYYLLSDGDQEVADTPAEEAVLPEPAETTTVEPTRTATPAPLAPPTVRKSLISTHSGNASEPAVCDDWVVWAHKVASVQSIGSYNTDFYAYNLTTEQATLVTSVEKGPDPYPLVAGDLLVWLEYGSFKGYRLGAPDAQEFSVTDFRRLASIIAVGEGGKLAYIRPLYALSDRVLVWSDAEDKDTYDILAYDLDRNERVRITDDDHRQTWPAAAGSLIVWADERNDAGDVYGYDLDTREELPLVTAPLTQTMPSTDGRHVVWIDGRDGNDDVYAYDLESQTEFPVFTGPGDRFLPGVWGDFVIWMEQDSDGRCVYGYDLRLDERFAIACDGGWPSDARIWGDVVVWSEYREEEEAKAVYSATLEY